MSGEEASIHEANRVRRRNGRLGSVRVIKGLRGSAGACNDGTELKEALAQDSDIASKLALIPIQWKLMWRCSDGKAHAWTAVLC